jgi:hypothetical protein
LDPPVEKRLRAKKIIAKPASIRYNRMRRVLPPRPASSPAIEVF